MGSHSLRGRLAGVAIAALLTGPATAAPSPSPSMGTACLANIAPDLSCADPLVMRACIAGEKVDAEILAACLGTAGCAEDEAAETALWVAETCQEDSNNNNTPQQQGSSEGELRRRRRFRARSHKRADSTPTSDASSTRSAPTTTSTVESYQGINIGLSSAIVGSVLGVTAFVAITGVIVNSCMENAALKKAKREKLQRKALMSNIAE